MHAEGRSRNRRSICNVKKKKTRHEEEEVSSNACCSHIAVRCPPHFPRRKAGKAGLTPRVLIPGADCGQYSIRLALTVCLSVGDPNLTRFHLLQLCSVLDKPAGSEKIWLGKFCKSQSSIQAVAFHMVHGRRWVGRGVGDGVIGQKAERTRAQTGARRQKHASILASAIVSLHLPILAYWFHVPLLLVCRGSFRLSS